LKIIFTKLLIFRTSAIKIFQQTGVSFFQFFDFWADDQIAVRLIFMHFVIIFVIIFGFVKNVERLDMRDDWFVVRMLFFEFLNEAVSFGTLTVIGVENDRAILRADIITLSVQCRRIMGEKENCQ